MCTVVSKEFRWISVDLEVWIDQSGPSTPNVSHSEVIEYSVALTNINK